MPTRYRPGGGETISPPPADGSLTVAKIAADLHPSKLQAASVPIAKAAAQWDRQTDGQTDTRADRGIA